MKEYKHLNIPKEYDFLIDQPVNTKWNVLVSERSIGKTTNVLLMGMCMNKLYGTVIQYVRLKDDMIKASLVEELYKTIIEYKDAYYIKQLTEGKYNYVKYHWKKLYYAYRDDNGNILEVAPDPFLQFLSIDRSQIYKSSYNAPSGDIVVFDEFVDRMLNKTAFIDFCDLTKTIFRDRTCPRIFMLANTLDPYNYWFQELEIGELIRKMNIGDKRLYTTDGGTELYVTIMKNRAPEKRKLHNKLFYGFKNPQLASITGDSTWAFKNCQHIFTHELNEDEYSILTKRLYVEAGLCLLRLDLFMYKGVMYANVHRATKVYDDSIIYTMEYDRRDSRYRYKFGTTELDKVIWDKLYKNNRFYYDSNETASILNGYVRNAYISKPYD